MWGGFVSTATPVSMRTVGNSILNGDVNTSHVEAQIYRKFKMPPKPVVRMAGGRRVAKGRRTGPSSEKAKLYRQDDKERLKKAAKKDKVCDTSKSLHHHANTPGPVQSHDTLPVANPGSRAFKYNTVVFSGWVKERHKVIISAYCSAVFVLLVNVNPSVLWSCLDGTMQPFLVLTCWRLIILLCSCSLSPPHPAPPPSTSSETAVDMCKGFGVVVVVSALLFVVVKQVSSLYTPEEVRASFKDRQINPLLHNFFFSIPCLPAPPPCLRVRVKGRWCGRRRARDFYI